MKLSVVIALYNNKQYIAKAIMSVINSKLKLYEYEIIVINDGSTDGSELVVEELVDCYPNIILINKENGGQSSARNIGFELARGKYILCLDSDDYINSGLLDSELDLVITNNLDMYAFSFVRHKGDTVTIEHACPLLSSAISCDEFLAKFTLHGAMCMYFYKTEIIQNNSLKLIEGVFLEDEEFVLKYILHSNSIMCRQTPLYNYIQNENSSTNNKSLVHRIRLMNDLVVVIRNVSNLESLKKSKMKQIGVLKKKEQLITSFFINLFSYNIPLHELQDLLLVMKHNQLYPYKVCANSFKFKLMSLVFNNSFLIKLALYIRNQWN